jgi:hypothetical protein
MHMIFKSKQNYKDLIDKPVHKGMNRRDFLLRGLATGALSVAVPQIAIGTFLREAQAAGMACPPPMRNPGAIAQIFSSGGPTMGARFISEAQASLMNATMAANYGISGQSTLVKLGPNMVIDSLSPFGYTLLQGPLGYPGGAVMWKTNVLSKISGGGHLGPFNADDGAGVNSGLIGGVSPFKSSQMGKDLQIGVSNTLASWANGLPSASVSSKALTPTTLAGTFSMVPAATGLVTTSSMNSSSDAANGIAQALSGIFGTGSRKGASQLQATAGCALYGNAALADPNYGAALFNPANISSLTSKLTVASLTMAEQAQLAAYYQAAVGVAGGVAITFNGRDYHGQSPQNVIAPADIEEARAIVMFLAACDAAQAKGSMLYFSNGQAIAKGVQAVTATINGMTANLMAPVAAGDAGGAYNAGLAIFYDPAGAPPQGRFTGSVDGSGNAKTDGGVGSSKEAVAGLYLSALQWINGGSIPALALSTMKASGVAGTPSNILVI